MSEIKDIPLVSVIVPCYNSSLFIASTLDSIVQQTYSNIEVICLNDGSTDNTEEIIKIYCEKYSNFLLIHKSNTGVSDTRNQGLRLAKGELVLFLDSDDVLTPDNIATHVEALKTNKAAGFSSAIMIKIDENGSLKNLGEWLGVTNTIHEDILSYNQSTGTCPSAYVFRKAMLLSHQIIFDQELTSTADRYFLCRVGNHAFGVRNSPKPTVLYREHKGGMSATLNKALIDDNALFFNKIEGNFVVNRSISKKFRFKTNYILAGAYKNTKQYGKFLHHSFKAMWASPKLFFLTLIGSNNKRPS